MNKKHSKSDPQFVADGHERALQGCVETAEKKIRAKYAKQLAEAGYFQRIYVRAIIAREIRREVKKLAGRTAPPDALYFQK